jgi:CubicO group peptidase (beta-lactamase class C family)
MSLEELLEPYLVPGGATYTEGESYNENIPGAKFVYSNFGAALVGLVIERATGKPFATSMRELVFSKLGLAGTSFLLADLDPKNVATPYTYGSSLGQLPEPQSSVPYLPATALRSPAKELARFLACITNGGEIDGVRLLSRASVEEMTKQQVSAAEDDNDIQGQGLLWERRPVAGAPCVGHGGSYFGTSTRMHYRESDKLGVITLANGDVHLRFSLSRREELAAYVAIEQRLFEEGARI